MSKGWTLFQTQSTADQSEDPVKRHVGCALVSKRTKRPCRASHWNCIEVPFRVIQKKLFRRPEIIIDENEAIKSYKVHIM